MQDQDHVYKNKTSIYVLEEPRDQDHGLEDYNTANNNSYNNNNNTQ